MFQDAGYKGLYNGHGVREIKKLKQVPEKENLLDHMGIAELAANLFRETQTDEQIKREKIKGQDATSKAHRNMGQEVRQLMIRKGNTPPESIKIEPSIRPLMEKRKRLTSQTHKQKQMPE